MADYSSDRIIGPPTTGRYQDGDTFVDATGSKFKCFATGSPGFWGSTEGAPDPYLHVSEGYSRYDDFLTVYDPGGGVLLTDAGRYDIALVGGASVTPDTVQNGDVHIGAVFLSSADGSAQLNFTGGRIINTNTPIAPAIWDLRARIAGRNTAVSGENYMGLFVGAYAGVPTIDTTPGIWFEMNQVGGFSELSAHVFDGATAGSVLLAPTNTTLLFRWVRILLDEVAGTAKFYGSNDGLIWVQQGPTVTGLLSTGFEGGMALLARVFSVINEASTLYIDFWRLDNPAALRPSNGITF